MSMLHRPGILILDFGSQYTQLIARRVREMNVYCEIASYRVDSTHLNREGVLGIILSGGPASSLDENSPRIPAWVFEYDCPVLGVCYGMQAMALQLSGQVTSAEHREYGHASLSIRSHALFAGIVDKHQVIDVWMSHGDHVTQLPPGFNGIASTPAAPIAAFAHETKPWYGLQFHPEVTHTPQGVTMLRNFVLTLCHAPANWTTSAVIDELITTIRQQVGSDRVLLALSGGVDSSVVAALLHHAIGAQLVSVFVDTGLLRRFEVQQIRHMFTDTLGIDVLCVDAADVFLNRLNGVSCPETKRKVIGETFIDVFAKEARRLAGIPWLAQGTIYPDVIESAGLADGHAAALIKSHHNVAGLPDDMPFKLVEPLRELFKDEVRALGAALGLPQTMVKRHPFPGPGLAVRVLGEVKPDYLRILQHADHIFIQALRDAGLYDTVSQAFAVFLPVKSVGVMGDGRCYDYVIALRAVQTDDFMTAVWAPLPWEFLGEVSNAIINQVNGVSRVVYDISGKPPATIEWE